MYLLIYFGCTACGTHPIRDWTHAPCNGSKETFFFFLEVRNLLLGHQGNPPPPHHFWSGMYSSWTSSPQTQATWNLRMWTWKYSLCRWCMLCRCHHGCPFKRRGDTRREESHMKTEDNTSPVMLEATWPWERSKEEFSLQGFGREHGLTKTVFSYFWTPKLLESTCVLL